MTRRRKPLHSNQTPPLPRRPTNATPGSLAKQLIMRDRIAAGYQPHHPGDARLPNIVASGHGTRGPKESSTEARGRIFSALLRHWRHDYALIRDNF